ncbi:MAG: hypothetical protein Fur0012_07260 [Elusimicrobiota bacterium]
MILRSIVFYFLVCFLQYWWASHLSVFGTSPNFPLMASVTSAVLFSPSHSLIFSFMMGFFADFSSWGHFGIYCLSYTLISYMLNSLKSRTDLGSGFSRNLLFLAFFYFNLLFYSLFYFAIYKAWFFGWKDFIFSPFLSLLLFEFFHELAERYLSVKKCL